MAADTRPRKPNPGKEGLVSEMGVLSGLGWATWIGERGVRPVPIPPQYWTADAPDGAELAVIACPCGHEPRVEKLAAPARCGGENCERWFFFTGEAVYVFNSERDRAVEADEEEQEIDAGL